MSEWPMIKLIMPNKASIKTQKDEVQRASMLVKTWRGREMAHSERAWKLRALFPLPTCCPRHLFYLAAPELHHFTTNQSSSEQHVSLGSGTSDL